MRTTTITIPAGQFFYDAEFPWLYGLSGFVKNSNLEAAPFYESITITRSGTGMRSKSEEIDGVTETTEETVNYTRTCKFNRISYADNLPDPVYFSQVTFKDGQKDDFFVPYPEVKSVDDGTTQSVSDGECYIHHKLVETIEGVGVRPDYKKHYLEFKGTCVFDPITYGTRTFNDGLGTPTSIDTTDLFSSIVITGPTMYRKNPDSLFFDTWNCRVGLGYGGEYTDVGYDMSGFSATKWRNLKGENFSFSVEESVVMPEDPEFPVWDTNTVEHTVEWEIT